MCYLLLKIIKGLEIWPVTNHYVCFCIHQVYSYVSVFFSYYSNFDATMNKAITFTRSTFKKWTPLVAENCVF